MFEDSLLDYGGRGRTRKPATIAFSFLVQATAVGILMLVGLIQGEALPIRPWMTLLTAPPSAPPPPKMEAARVRITPRPAQQSQDLTQPSAIPAKVAIIVEEVPPPSGPLVGFIAVPGGTGEALFRGIINPAVEPVAPPPPPAPPSLAPVRIGGQVAAAKLISRPMPAYPPLARQARIQGTVRLEAVISKDGAIVNLAVISGHPLLIQAAIEAVKQWRYQPTLLNGEAVEVITTVDVNFILGQ